MYELDFDRVISLINVILENISFIKEESISSVEQLKRSKKDYYAVSMALFTIQNKLIELGEEVIESLDKNLYPKKYLDIVEYLYQEKLLSDLDYNIFKDFVSYRNEIAHEYEGITENEIFWCINNLDFVEKFIKLVKKNLLE